MKPSVRGAIVLLALLFTADDVLANAVPELSLEKKARLSDLVVIGRVESTRPEKVGAGEEYEYARVHVDRVLKGKPPDQLDVLFRGMVAEFDPDCCEVGKSYLFFLVKQKRIGRFESVNGPFGIYPIPGR
jgi:hypothetical protein